MKSVKELILSIHSDMEAKIPGILDSNGLKHFEKYAIGNSVEKQELALYVKISEYTRRGETVAFLAHAQLPGDEIEMNEYMDAINEYFEDYFSPEKIGYLDFSYSIAAADDARAAIVNVFWDVALTKAIDDCDT